MIHPEWPFHIDWKPDGIDRNCSTCCENFSNTYVFMHQSSNKHFELSFWTILCSIISDSPFSVGLLCMAAKSFAIGNPLETFSTENV